MVTHLSMGMVEADLRAAGRAIESYKVNNSKYDKNVAAYHIQQAVEKLIKIQIYAMSDGDFVDRALYTHQIDRLIHFAESNKLECIVPKYIKENSVLISEWEVSGRYDLHFSVNVKTLEAALKVTMDWYEEVYKAGCR